jgi:hypothetical protein
MSASQDDTSPIASLPNELILEVGSYLDNQSLGRFFSSSRKHRDVLGENFRIRQLAQSFVENVMRGNQHEAEEQLQLNPNLLTMIVTATDYSERTFTCTGYEYAYWAKDTHMRRMMEQYMTNEIKEELLERIQQIEIQGLSYEKGDENICGSSFFNFKPLLDAYQAFIVDYDEWYRAENWDAMNNAWLEVGKAQRDLPVHVINEYCRQDRAFVVDGYPPNFDEESLPRTSSFFNLITRTAEELYPDTSSLGNEYSLIRVITLSNSRPGACATSAHKPIHARLASSIDCWAVSRLDEVRTKELNTSLEVLKNRQALAMSNF